MTTAGMYSSILEQWLGLDPVPIVDGTYEQIDFFEAENDHIGQDQAGLYQSRALLSQDDWRVMAPWAAGASRFR